MYLQYLIGFCLVSQLCPVADPVWVGRVGKWSKCSRRELFSIFPPPPADSPAPSPCSVTLLLSSSPDDGQDPPPGLLGRSWVVLASTSNTPPLLLSWVGGRFLSAWLAPDPTSKCLTCSFRPFPPPHTRDSRVFMVRPQVRRSHFSGLTLGSSSFPLKAKWESRNTVHLRFAWAFVLPISRSTFFIGPVHTDCQSSSPILRYTENTGLGP